VALGEIDRATWRVRTASGRLELLPDPVREALRTLAREAEPPPAGARVLLRSDAHPLDDADDALRDAATVRVHPDSGFADGQAIRLRVGGVACAARARLDGSLRQDAVDVIGADACLAALYDALPRDPFTRARGVQGVACAVEPA
jgi:hypothetical protein